MAVRLRAIAIPASNGMERVLARGRPDTGVIDDARALLATGPLCDHCLGRPFAQRSFGLTNAERGQALRTAVAMADDEPYDASDAATCWVCNGRCTEFDTWVARTRERLGDVAFETYQVGTRTPPLIEENDRLLREDAGLDPDAGEPFKSEYNREVGRRLGQATGAEVDFERPDVLALLDLADDTVEVQVNPAFVYGRYRKLERDIPQTEWPCRECGGSGTTVAGDSTVDCEHCDGTGYLYPTSVEQLVAPPIVEAMVGTEGVFHGAGREDVDARMLETGRPFVVEVKQPRTRRPDMSALAAAIDEHAGEQVAVDGLRLATHEMVERVKEHAASKTYRAQVTFDAPVDEAALADAVATLDGATIQQDTPQRVDHRRASKTRTRTVYDISATLEAPTEATVEIHGEGGLYVKELVSGDEGRTEPSLAGLLDVDATVTALDVLAVEGEDEPFEQPAYFLE
jgi:tRNA pseudouridine synthase 10